MTTRTLFLWGLLLSHLPLNSASAQIILPAPRPVGPPPITANPALLPATVVSQSSTAPIPSSNALRPQAAPFNSFNGINSFGGYLGGGYFLYYPPVYSAPIYNNTVNVNLSVVNPDPGYSPIYRTNPLYGVEPVEPISRDTARLILQIPTDAEVWINGEKTPQKGARRIYESPKITNGKPFAFEVKITWLENDKRMNEERKLSLGAGESRTLMILSAR
jgi:uncharacterized protein (TIGR03000 family)